MIVTDRRKLPEGAAYWRPPIPMYPSMAELLLRDDLERWGRLAWIRQLQDRLGIVTADRVPRGN